ncbi:hypothetical protein LTR91_000100 [Friedmanniomyces endolithicus]|uniref:Heterokaryon incompatibility domain-containing protein n=1 Tax=Friedmanniomyces endolithicus TaxID=329885 RepID=A0AAN6FSE4_9PEZI|nr:hypothetical protein LTR35_001535 [Friedmanniomyces endolithicus]KAK0298020.1 hypothetical protein LTS00_003559 [Friedmanniomyces endolithicus]KAK0322615.1 hypothetical protein LTR82_006575 [Friedmanniomyces endolithicus]KAK0931153.1 hypothetical protein LTR57_000566 [Friedmanniomyces endolithicus]KAK1014036.1 hypothetical protein LTS01_000566 [Friedmanniomyces endolithicus]
MIHMDRYNLLPGPGFLALSYRWGDENIIGTMQLRNIFVDDTTDIAEDYETKELPQSTLDMLVELHKTERLTGRWFWIDVLCLNQADILEKSAQVRLMGSIFELASEALVYVGPEIESTALAMEFWERLRVIFAELPQVDADGQILYLSHEESLRYTGATWASPEWEAIQKHLTRPWFRRLWVMQEAVLPHSVIYIWGRFALTAHDMRLFPYWDMRSSLSMMLYQHDSSCWFSAKRIAEIAFLRSNRTQANKHWIGVLHNLVWWCDGAHATDPRDRIYGLLGLLGGEDLGIVPDYSPENTVESVYTDATRRSLTRHGSFNIMYGAGAGWKKDNLMGNNGGETWFKQPDTQSEADPSMTTFETALPSWVPDFNRTFAHLPGDHLSAGIGHVAVEPAAFEGDFLIIPGYVVDTITLMMDFKSPRPLSGEVAEVEEDPYTTWYLRTALELMKVRHPSPWSASFYASFWRTLTFYTSNVADDVAQFPPAEYGDTLASLDVVKESGILTDSSTRVSTSVQRQRFLTTAMAFGSWHAVCVTSSGSVGLVPRYTKVGDVVAVCPGARAPFVLRPTESETGGKKVFQFVGTGYVHELNDGIHVAASKGSLESIVLR